jgi:hypothetical protein
MFRESYYVHPKAWFEPCLDLVRIKHFFLNVRGRICDDHPMLRYRRRRANKFTQRITACLSFLCVFLAFNLAVKGCSGVFYGVYRGLIFSSFGERCLFCGVLRLQICDSVWSGLPTLNFDVADGRFFHD